MSELIKKYNHIRFIRVEHNKGYGHGILCGLENAKGEILSWTHADMQTETDRQTQTTDTDNSADRFTSIQFCDIPPGDVTELGRSEPK